MSLVVLVTLIFKGRDLSGLATYDIKFKNPKYDKVDFLAFAPIHCQVRTRNKGHHWNKLKKIYELDQLDQSGPNEPLNRTPQLNY